jgi:hypothetical protein
MSDDDPPVLLLFGIPVGGTITMIDDRPRTRKKRPPSKKAAPKKPDGKANKEPE